MKHSTITIAILAGTLSVAGVAQANNSTVENALKNRPDLSVFYDNLQSTGVLSELKENQPYTVFAPTNDAFAGLPASHYPCFYSGECRAQAAEVLRKHIVPGEKHLADMNPQAGIYSLFSIDNQHIIAGEPNKDKFTVDGKRVLSENQLLGGILYKIDGVMVSDKDLVQFEAPKVVMVTQPGTDLPPRVPEGKIVTITTTDHTTPVPY